MKIKTYLCEDVKEGMRRIKEEHGLEAIIVDIKNNGGSRGAKGCEISVAVEGGPIVERDDLTELRMRMEGVWDRAIGYVGGAAGLMEKELIRDRIKTYPLPLRTLFDKMTKNGVESRSALAILSEVYCALGPLAEESPKAGFFVKEAIRSRVRFYNPLSARTHLALVGTSGAGKTETVVKLVNLCADGGIRASVLAFEVPKGTADLGSFPEELSTRLDTNGTRKIIDFTGDFPFQVKLALRLPQVKLLMVLPAGARDEKMKHCCDMLTGQNVAGLIFTKIDEEEAAGHIFGSLLRLSLPLCYLTCGSAVKDILTPDSDILYKILIEGNPWKRRENGPLP